MDTLKNIFFISILIFGISCTQNQTVMKQNQSISFEVIDITFCRSSWAVQSIKVSNDGKCFIYFHVRDPDKNYKSFYNLTLDKKDIDSLVRMSNKILISTFDSIVSSIDQDHSDDYTLIIKTKKRKFKTTFKGQMFYNKDLKFLDDLASYLLELSHQKIEFLDNNLIFESWTKSYLDNHVDIRLN